MLGAIITVSREGTALTDKPKPDTKSDDLPADDPEQTWIIAADGKRVKTEEYAAYERKLEAEAKNA